MHILIRYGILCAVNVLLFWRTIFYGWICDDIAVVRISLGKPKPKSKFVLFWNYLIGQQYWSSKAAHLLVFTVHIINTLLVYTVFGANEVSFIAALFFCVFPTNTHAGVWISGKPYSLSTMFVLLAWGTRPWGSVWYYFAGTFFFSFNALFSSLMFVISPYPWLSLMTPFNILRERASIFKKDDPSHKYHMESNPELKAVAPRKLIPYFKSLGYNFCNIIIPHTLGFYHPFLFTHGYTAKDNKNSYRITPYFFAGLFIVALLFYGLLYHRASLWTFGLLWYVINMSMWCNFITMNQPVALRYTYLPSVGVALMYASLLQAAPFWIPWCLLGAYAVRLWGWLPFYKNEYTSVEYAAVVDVPDFYYAYLNRAAHCFFQENYHGAVANLNTANRLRPGDYKILINLVQMTLLLGNLDAAKKYFEELKTTTIDGRAAEIAIKNAQLEQLLKEVEEAGKKSRLIQFDLSRFEIVR